MNREFLLDSLDGMKSLVLGLLGPKERETIVCVPMITDGPWNDHEIAIYEKITGIPSAKTLWAPAGYDNVPFAENIQDRERWLTTLYSVESNSLFLDPDTGFYEYHTKTPTNGMLLVSELKRIAESGKVLIVYRHEYWYRVDGVPGGVNSYVWHALGILKASNLHSFAYQSKNASLFFLATEEAKVAKYWDSLRVSMAGVSPEIVNRRLIRRAS
jgi:hypothetical protein